MRDIVSIVENDKGEIISLTICDNGNFYHFKRVMPDYSNAVEVQYEETEKP